MKVDYTFTAEKKKEGLVIQGRPFFDRVVSTLKVGDLFVLHLKTFKKKRSTKANRFLWGACYDQALEAILTEDGYRRDEWASLKRIIHEGLCAKYQGYVTCPVTKQQVRKFHSSEATAAEFADYIRWIAQVLAEDYHYALQLPEDRL